MKQCRSQRWVAVPLVFVAGGLLLGGLVGGCSGRKQVPFGLQDAGQDSSAPAADLGEEAAALPVGETFGPDQV